MSAASEVVREAGRLLAAGGAWRTLLDRHVADSGGRCRGCRSSSGGAPVWPCALRAIAEEARRIAALPP